MAEETLSSKKNILTRAGLKKLEDELNDLKVNKMQEISKKIGEAREQGDLSENAEYDAAKDEQRDIQARIEEIEGILKNAEVVDEEEGGTDKVNIGCRVRILDMTYNEENWFSIVGSTEASPLQGKISNESPVGHALIGQKVGDVVQVEVGDSKPQDLNQLRKVRREKLQTLIDAGENPYEIVTYDQSEHSRQIKEHYADYENQEVSIAGRLMSKRVMGKASFGHVQDRDGQIQIYVSRDDLGDEAYAKFKHLDVGDLVGVKGRVFTTKMGEISVHAASVTLLSKSLQILPEKFHGLTDTDIRYRQRYVDLIMNPEVRTVFIKRSKIIASIRRYLDARDFIEVETPMLVDNAGGAAARPFVTHFNALDEDKKLRISLELYLKRLIVGGLERVYEIGRVFRNEGLDMKHNPEFTLMELYQAYTDYNGMMDLTEDMYRHVCQEVNGTTKIVYKGNEIDLGKPFARMTMTEAVKQYSGVDFDQIHTVEEARAAARAHNVEYEDRHAVGDILNLFFDAFVEEHLIQPTFITGHPIEISPLTKKDPEHPGKVLRFEMYVNGWEMCNAYSELNDPIDQRERFRAQEELLAQGDEEANHTDEDFLNALEIGMPPTGGIGYGIDRMCMLLTGAETIRDVLLFPTMRSLKAESDDIEDKKD